MYVSLSRLRQLFKADGIDVADALDRARIVPSKCDAFDRGNDEYWAPQAVDAIVTQLEERNRELHSLSKEAAVKNLETVARETRAFLRASRYSDVARLVED